MPRRFVAGSWTGSANVPQVPRRDGKMPLRALPQPTAPNKTSNQTFKGSLVSCPRLPVFASFPFRFPFRGEKGSAPAGGSKGGGERRSGRQREGGSKEANRQRFEETSRMLPGGRGQRRRRAETAPEGPQT